MMEMSAELTAEVLENILRHGKFNIPTRNAMENAVRILRETPEVVRCKGCKHQNWVNAETGCIVCKFGRGTNAPDWFCADGERGTDDA